MTDFADIPIAAALASYAARRRRRGLRLAAGLFRRLSPAAALFTLFSGCATVRMPMPADPSFAIHCQEKTRLGTAFASSQTKHPGQSGFALLDYGLEALVARASIADAAEQAIDVQYYIFENDEAGSLLMERLLSAADRGVRVRLLLDDFNLGNERELVALCGHPRIQVRIFNPVSRGLRWARFLEYAVHFHRADRRMHNKLFIVDNEVAILGGRNIGDNYFNVSAPAPFRDFDVLGAGPIATQASATFDRFWNSSWSVPVPALIGRWPSSGDLAWLRNRIKARVNRAARFESDYQATGDRYMKFLEGNESALAWADAEIISDPPEIVESEASGKSLVARCLDENLAKTAKEALIEAAYFAPDPDRIEVFEKLRDRGVSVRLLTSDSVGTDVPIVYSVYRGFRSRLLEAGVELYEFRPSPAFGRAGSKWYRRRPSNAALHSKVIVFDGQMAWIGSYNLDPRSARLNTEIAVLIHSEQLAGKLARSILDDCSPDSSWRVRLATEAGHKGDATTPITWSGNVDGHAVTLHHEPASIGRRIKFFFYSLIPGIRDQI